MSVIKVAGLGISPAVYLGLTLFVSRRITIWSTVKQFMYINKNTDDPHKAEILQEVEEEGGGGGR